MKKIKLLVCLLLVLLLPLASCSLLNDEDINYEIGTPKAVIWTDSINTKWIKIAVPVTNTGNTGIYLNDCSIDIESPNGSLLQTLQYVGAYPEYIKPGETAYYYDETSCDFIDNNVNAVPNIQPSIARNDIIRYDISDVSITKDTYTGVKIMGRVSNNTSDTGSLVMVIANLFDINNELICNCFTYLENDLYPGSRIGFTITPFAYNKFSPSLVARYEIYSYPSQFNW